MAVLVAGITLVAGDGLHALGHASAAGVLDITTLNLEKSRRGLAPADEDGHGHGVDTTELFLDRNGADLLTGELPNAVAATATRPYIRPADRPPGLSNNRASSKPSDFHPPTDDRTNHH